VSTVEFRRRIIDSTRQTVPGHTISSSLPLLSSHPVPAPQIRSRDFWRYINLYVCMYVCMLLSLLTLILTVDLKTFTSRPAMVMSHTQRKK